MDFGRKPTGAGAPVSSASPASKLHTRTSSHILDLSAAKAAPIPAAPSVKPVTRSMAKPPATTVHERHIAQFEDRFEQARHYSRSAQISRFGQDRFGNIQDPHKMYDKFGNPKLETLVNGAAHSDGSHAASPGVSHAPRPTALMTPKAPQLPHMAATQHAAMNQLAFGQPAAAPTAPTARLSLSPAASRMFTVAAAVLIMGGYIWLQNYPKLAIQTADARSGVAASLPAYLPSSYNLASTNVSPGIVTLKFTSPSADNALTIAQQRTDWDPSSLVSNYIAKTTDDYAAIQGQGLTIYMFGENQATWVNRGVWFSINGASRLSRDDILKIAYSL
jgi:hypothetical protein